MVFDDDRGVALTMFYKQKRQTEMIGSTQAPVDLNKEMQPQDAFKYIKETSKERKFEESIETIVKLSVDPTKGD